MLNRRKIRKSGSPFALLAALLSVGLPYGGVHAEDKPDAKPAETKPATGEMATAPKEYRLQSGDEIQITVTPQKEYSFSSVILADGTISVKDVGDVKAAGMTRAEVAEAVRKGLDKTLVDPEVRVTILKLVVPKAPEAPKPLRVTVVGGVIKPGPVEVDKGTVLLKAIDLAGGTAKDADLKEILILHKDQTKTIVDLSSPARFEDRKHNLELEDGDSIRIAVIPPKKKEFVSIQGAVAKPGKYEILEQGQTLATVIEQAGKLVATADPHQVKIAREGQTVQVYDLEALAKETGLAADIPLQGGDIVSIPEYKNSILLVGAIDNPGPLPIEEGGMTIGEFFTSGAKTNRGAFAVLNGAKVDLRSVEVIRDGEESRKVNLIEAMRKRDSKHNVELHSGDVVFLRPKSESPGFAKNIQGLQYLGVLTSLFGLF